MMLLARYALILPAVMVLAVYLPLLFDVALGQRVQTTHLFYSPVIKKFVWNDKLLEAKGPGLEDTHHAQFVQMDQDGKRYTRQEFEKLLPFIYYKNMELWGLLPLRLEGRVFDKQTIKDNRRVIELKPAQIEGRSMGEELLPLLESRPDTARLVFPEDRFRLGAEMEFVNADFNQRDDELTQRFTNVLREAGFVFPGRLAAGKPTILKPFDEGVFLVDATGAVFHLKRVDGQPQVVKTPIPPQVGVRHIKISENRQREFYGLLLGQDDRLYLISYDDYRLVPLPMPGYDPDRMDFKLIINPLYRTALYNDRATIWAVVMDQDYQPIARYQHTMPGAGLTTAQEVFYSLAPFQIRLSDPTSGYLTLTLDWHGRLALISLGLGLAGFLGLALRRRPWGAAFWLDGVLVLCTGLYGLAVVGLLPHQKN